MNLFEIFIFENPSAGGFGVGWGVLGANDVDAMLMNFLYLYFRCEMVKLCKKHVKIMVS